MRLYEKDFKQDLSAMHTKIRRPRHGILNLTPLPRGCVWREAFLYQSK